jgi:predicted permease
MQTLWQDLRYGARMLFKNPGFTLIAVFTLALGIGANTAIFSVIDALMLRTLPISKPERLVMVWTRDGSAARSDYSFYHPLFVKFREHSQVFAGVAAIWLIERSNLAINGDVEPRPTQVGLASGDYFPTLGVQAALGRCFTQDDDRAPGGHPVAVISDGYWERRFARAPNIVGRAFTLHGLSYTIIGVAPRGFTGEWVGKPTDLWIPFAMESQVMPEVPGLQRYPTRVIARLKPGVTMSQAQAASQLLYQQLLREATGQSLTPQQIAEQRLELEPGARGYSPQRESFAAPLAILTAMVGLLLLVACANVANLLLARAATRQREMAVRLALGAGPARIVRQLLTESVLLAMLGGALGLLFAVWGTDALNAMMAAAPAVMSNARLTSGIALYLRPDARVFAFTALLCLGAGILFGLAPAFRGAKAPRSPALGERGVGSGGSWRRFGLGKALVVAQVALSLLLLIGAGLFARTLRNLKSQDLGFDRQRLLLVWTVPGQTGRQGPEVADLWQTALERISSLPGVVSASAVNGGVLTGYLPAPGRTSVGMMVEGQPPKPTNIFGGRSFVAPRFFETMGIPFVAGRDFTERDNETSPSVVIINETMARFYFDDQNPVGRFVRWSANDAAPTEIVGVVKDFVRGTPRGASLPEFSTYFPYRDREGINRGAQSRLRGMMIAARTTGDPLAMAAAVRRELREVDPRLPIIRINTIAEQLDDILMQDRLVAALSGFFGALSGLLACAGLYGVISYSVARRTREIGVRLALGATPAAVLRMTLKESLWLTLAGVAIGIAVAMAATRLVSARLFGVGAADPLTIVVAALLMMAVAALSAFLPARRAAKVDPLIALRCD